MAKEYQNIPIFQYKISSDILLSTAITLLLIFLYMILVKIPLPFLTEDAIKEYFNSGVYINSSSVARFSILPLGLMPYVSNGRRKLKSFALLLTLLLGIIQGYGIINGLLGMTLPNGEHLLNIKNDFDFLLLMAILVGGVYFLIIICELISKYGFGNGVSLILLVGICSHFFDSFNQMIPIYNEIGPGLYLLSFCVFCVLVFFTIFLLKSKRPVEIRHRLMDSLFMFAGYNAVYFDFFL
jgi:preprotein translocase subunit SecY